MELMARHIVSSLHQPVRLSDYLIGVFEQLPTRSSIKKAFKAKRIFVDGNSVKGGIWLQQGQCIELYASKPAESKLFQLKLHILYEDDCIAVVNKPAGVAVSGNFFKTIERALPYNLKLCNRSDALTKPRVAHRLDAATSGLLLVAKTQQARIFLGDAFQNRSIQKTYTAVVQGLTANSGAMQFSIEGRAAYTQYERLQYVPSLRNQFLSLLQLQPVSGRKHQLRVHLAAIGHPIVGDKIHGQTGNIMQHKGLFLCASKIVFKHPETLKILTFELSCPAKYSTLMQREKRRFDRYFNTTK